MQVYFDNLWETAPFRFVIFIVFDIVISFNIVADLVYYNM